MLDQPARPHTVGATGSVGHYLLHFSYSSGAGLSICCLKIQAKERLGIGGPKVEPPVATINSEAIHSVLLSRLVVLRNLLNDLIGVGDLGVDLA